MRDNPWKIAAVVFGVLALALGAVVAVQAATLHRMGSRLLAGTLPEWLSALGSVATVGAVLVAWLAYRREVHARRADLRREAHNVLSPIFQLVTDLAPSEVFPIIISPDQIPLLRDRAQAVDALRSRWHASRDRFTGYFIAHPSDEVSSAAFTLERSIEWLLTSYARRAPLVDRMVELSTSPQYEHDEPAQNEIDELQEQFPDDNGVETWNECENACRRLVESVNAWKGP